MEGGINYWFNEGGYDLEVKGKTLCEVLKFEIPSSVEITSDEDAGEAVVNSLVNAQTLSKAARKIVNGEVKVSPRIAQDILEEREGMDADSADVLVQVCIFGELVYG